mgnify:CR=1 FL=1
MTVSEAATGDDTPTTLKQLKRVISTTPAPDGVNGKAEASSGIIVRKTASEGPILKSNASVRQKIQIISKNQITAVRTQIGNSS